MTSFDSAVRKLSTAPSPYPLDDLPQDINDELWKEIRRESGLSLPEVGALKSYVWKQQQGVASHDAQRLHHGEAIGHFRSLLLLQGISTSEPIMMQLIKHYAPSIPLVVNQLRQQTSTTLPREYHDRRQKLSFVRKAFQWRNLSTQESIQSCPFACFSRWLSDDPQGSFAGKHPPRD